jgi:molecular chaperone DnaJ
MSTKDYVEKDYYKALGVAKDADAATIKKQYRKLARELHPDKNPGDAAAEARFKEVSEAYDVLGDADKRKEYDDTRAMFANGGYPGGFTGFGPGAPGGSYSTTFDASDLFGGGAGLGDLFGDLLGGRGGPRTRAGRGPGTRQAQPPADTRGADLEATVALDFESAVRGTTVPLSLSGPGTCTLCGGSGARPGTSLHTCPTCGGSGHVTRNQGGFGFSEPCRDCRGTGRVPDSPCPECGGSGVTNQTRTITVRVPPGVKDGAKLRLAGKGTPGRGSGPAGDLFVTVRVGSHPLFGRTGDNLTLTVPITYAEAALGTSLRVPTLDGAVTLKIAAGTPSGRTLRVRGRGVPRKNNAGDLLVTVEVAVPAKLTSAEKAVLEQLAHASTEDPRPAITDALHRIAASSPHPSSSHPSPPDPKEDGHG